MEPRNSYDYDWENNFKITFAFFKYMGLWPAAAEGYKLEAYTIYNFWFVFITVSHILSQVVNIYFVRNDVKQVAATSYITLIAFVGICKLYSVIKKNVLLKSIVDKLRSHWFQPRNYNQLLIVEPSVKFWKNIFNAYLGILLVCNIFWIIWPLIDKSTERRLPFLAWFPFDYKVSPFYEIVYVLQIICTIYFTLLHVNVDAFLSGLNVCVGCQFEMLADNIRNLGREMTGDELHQNLINCVLHHQEILNFINAVSPFSGWILFFHLIFSGICIGVTMFQLTMVVPGSSEFLSYVLFGVAATLEIFMYCWFASEMKTKSTLLTYAAFESNWLDKSEKFKKELIFLVLHTIKPASISPLNVFEVSIETFVKILRTAWSYFALLTTLSDEKYN